MRASGCDPKRRLQSPIRSVSRSSVLNVVVFPLPLVLDEDANDRAVIAHEAADGEIVVSRSLRNCAALDKKLSAFSNEDFLSSSA